MSNWYYSRDGARVGPHTSDEMRDVALAGDIGDDTLCWQESFGSTWKPLSETELCPPRVVAASVPPPLPVAHIQNRYAWIYASVPLNWGSL